MSESTPKIAVFTPYGYRFWGLDLEKSLQNQGFMEKYHLPEDIRVFGLRVNAFPEGIREIFDSLVKMLPKGFDRSCYGITTMSKEGVFYIAAALEEESGEAEKYGCERYRIEKGEYFTDTLMDWRSKTDSIKDIFQKMLQDSRVDKTKPCVEWYIDDHEMVCMVKAK